MDVKDVCYTFKKLWIQTALECPEDPKELPYDSEDISKFYFLPESKGHTDPCVNSVLVFTLSCSVEEKTLERS